MSGALLDPVAVSSSQLPELTDGLRRVSTNRNMLRVFSRAGLTEILWPLIIRISQLPSPDSPFITLFERTREFLA